MQTTFCSIVDRNHWGFVFQTRTGPLTSIQVEPDTADLIDKRFIKVHANSQLSTFFSVLQWENKFHICVCVEEKTKKDWVFQLWQARLASKLPTIFVPRPDGAQPIVSDQEDFFVFRPKGTKSLCTYGKTNCASALRNLPASFSLFRVLLNRHSVQVDTVFALPSGRFYALSVRNFGPQKTAPQRCSRAAISFLLSSLTFASFTCVCPPFLIADSLLETHGSWVRTVYVLTSVYKKRPGRKWR